MPRLDTLFLLPLLLLALATSARAAPADPAQTVAELGEAVRDAVTQAVWRFGDWLDLDEPEAKTAGE